MPNASDIQWLKERFGHDIEKALTDTPFDVDMIVAIACQETGYIWSVLRKKGLDTSEVLALCVGDTLDADRGRRAFPRNRAELIGAPRGDAMFDIARKALVDMAVYIPGYKGAAANADKFCHGFGMFQRDLQFFLDDPDYFLEERYVRFEDTLAQCLIELRRGVKKLGFQNKKLLTDYEFACVAIAYNTGGFNPGKKLKQGHFNGQRYYGEEVFDFIRLSRTVRMHADHDLGRYIVIARYGLNLRKGPSRDFGVTKILQPGTAVDVMSFDGASGEWARVDLEGDGLADGHLFAAFLERLDAGKHTENVEEPNGAEA